MRFGNWQSCTHDGTGGSADLTLAASHGFPLLSAAIGSAIRNVVATIEEFTGDPDAGVATLVRSEVIFCPLDATGTPVLKRSDSAAVVLASFDGTNLYPQQGSATAPSKQNFGNTPANIRIMCSPTADANIFATPAVTATSGVGAGLGQTQFGALVGGNFNVGSLIGNGVIAYVPFVWTNFGLYTQLSVKLIAAFSAATTSSLKVAIYEVGKNGDPGKLLADFGNLGALTSSGVLTSTALSTPLFLAPGFYYLALLPEYTGTTGTLTLSVIGAISGTPLGAVNLGGTNCAVALTGSGKTSLADPAAAPTGLITGGTVVVPMIGLK